MARPLRLDFPGAVHHVMARGHERGTVFRDDADRARWLELLGLVRDQAEWEVHAYCLMGNHYHLLVETPEAGLSAGLHDLNSRFAQWFNRRHRRRGHLFEGRFRGILVQKDAHLLELARYVVLNPVRAGVASGAGDWRWSSYRATAGLAPKPDWLSVDWTLGQLASSRKVARAAYRRFVAEGKGVPSPLDEVQRQAYLGDEAFLKEVVRRLGEQQRSDEIPLRDRRPAGPSLDRIRGAVAKEWGVPAADLSRNRGAEPKIAAIYLSRRLTRMKVFEVGEAFGVRSARVSNVIRQVEEDPRSRLAVRIRRVERRLISS
ncbi:MAG: transposase [Acidobacteria bacterium]|nr:transposase [Acidobacteriota bacterium]MCA1609786.1 transposase [Acidobacteriota bacterium]